MSKYPLVLAYPDFDDLFQYDNDEPCIGTYGLPVYFRLGNDDNLDAGSWHDPTAALTLKVSFRYKDEGTDPIQVGYTSDAATETTETVVTKTNTGEWKWVHYSLLATFRVAHDVFLNFFNADFRLLCDSELLLTNVTLKNLTTKARAVYKIPESEEATENDSISGPGTGAPPTNATYILVSGSGDLPNDRTLAVGNGLSKVDAGAGATVTLDLADAVAGAGLTISGKVLAVGAGAGITANANDVAINLASPSGLNTSSGLALDDSVAGAGLTISSKVLAVGAGNGLTVNANDVALTTPGTLTVATSNNAAGNHTHGITSSSNPGAAASLLATDASGFLTLVRLNTDTLADRSGANLTLAPAGDIVLDPTGNDVLPNLNYDINLGMLSKKYLTLHAAELWVETLVAQDTIATIGGRILVGPTTVLTADLAAGGTTITVKHNQMISGDRVYLEADGKVEFLAITSSAGGSAGAYTYSVTRNLDGSGANDWYAGDAVFNTGQTGNGFIDLYSVRGVKTAAQAGPTIVGNVRNSATYNDWSEVWAIGNLNGVYGYGVTTYGAAFGQYGAALNNVTLDATNGFRIRQHNTNLGQWAADGDLFLGTDVGSNGANPATTRLAIFNTSQTFGNLSAAQGDWFAGNASGKRIFYDASSGVLDIIGNLRLSDGAGANYGVNVGEALLLARFDGPLPYATNLTADAHGHRGQIPTPSSGVLYREGKFGKGLEIAEAVTNLVVNPSFENNITDGWTTVASWTSISQSSVQAYSGTSAHFFLNNTGADAFRYTTFTADATTTTCSFWIYRVSGSGTVRIYLQLNASPFTIIGTTFATSERNRWQRVVVSGATAIGTVYRLGIWATNSTQFYVDGVQAEGKAFVTPYADGSLGSGFAWTGTAHNSSSTRAASTFTYPATNNLNLVRGTAAGWYYNPGSANTFRTLLAVYIDANNYLVANVSSSPVNTLTPYAQHASGGVSSGTVSGAATAAAGWNHVAVTWDDEANALKLYLNGVQSGATAAYTTPAGTPTTIEFGTYNGGGNLDTVLDDMVVLPHVLTADEVKALAESNAPVQVESTIGEFRLTAAGKGQVFGNADGLFGQTASGGAAFALLTGAKNASAWGGASENLADGDALLGSNQSNKANLLWDESAGSLSIRIAQVQKFLASSSLLKYGSDVSAAATTAIAIFNSNQTYNAESVETSDLLIGDNSASKANLLWDKSAGILYLRTGTTANIWLDTVGVLNFKSNLTTQATYAQWTTSDAVVVGKLISYYGSNPTDDATMEMRGIGKAVGASAQGKVQLVAESYDHNSTSLLYMTSQGRAYLDFTNGSNVAHSTQALYLSSKTSTTNNQQSVIQIMAESTGTETTGFGSAIALGAHNSSGVENELAKVYGAWRNSGTTQAVFGIVVGGSVRFNLNESGNLSIGGSNVTAGPTEFFEFNDSNDKQAVIKADAQALNDDGWGTGAVDYNEYLEQGDLSEIFAAGDLVFVRGGRIYKAGPGTPMVVATRGGGFSGGLPLHWHKKWIEAGEYQKQYGSVPPTIREWKERHNPAAATAAPLPGQSVVRKLERTLVLNPEWDPTQAYVSRDRRPEWHPVAFMGQVQVKVRGQVNEGDFIVPSGKGDGYGVAVPYAVENVLGAVGLAWESKATTGAGTVLCAVGVK